MHSYVNATSTAEKRSNWDLLTKFFSVHGINLTKDTVDAIVSQQQAPVEKFLQQLYLYGRFLMKRLLATQRIGTLWSWTRYHCHGSCMCAIADSLWSVARHKVQ